MPAISVIIPVYKVEPYLHRCVDSVLAQSFIDFEIILVDDGSPDNCGKICDEYAGKDSRVHVIHQENKGLSAARNAGIEWAFENSDSKWISFIDSDDWVSPKFLELLYDAAIRLKARISACAFQKGTDSEMVESQIEANKIRWDTFYLTDPVTATIACNKLYDKALFISHRYPVGRLHEDEFLTYRLLYNAKEIAVLPARLYYYFQNGEGITKGTFNLRRLDAIKAIDEQCRFLKERGYNELLYSRIHLRLVRGSSYLIQMKENRENYDKNWKRAEKTLRNTQKRILFSEGKKVAPFKQNKWIYTQTFPVIMKGYWLLAGIKGKLSRKAEKKSGVR